MVPYLRGDFFYLTEGRILKKISLFYEIILFNEIKLTNDYISTKLIDTTRLNR